VPSPAKRTLVVSTLLAAFAVGAPAVGLLQTAAAAPGDNGDVKVHRTTTAVTDERDDPKVCEFYLDAFNFDTIQNVTYGIFQQPPTGRALVLSGALTLSGGVGHTATLTLPDGHYKLTWTFTGERGSAKHKVFMVDCQGGPTTPPPSGGPTTAPPTTAPPTGGPTTAPPSGRPSGRPSHPPGGGPGPTGPVKAGGGGTSSGPDIGDIAGGTALLTVGGGLLLRMRQISRRRNARARANG
jgi:hypothetical protein